MMKKSMSLGDDVAVADSTQSPQPVTLTPDTVRDFAVQLVRGYVPFDDGDAKYAEVCKDYSNAGTTCGYLPHWMMWRLGVRSNLVNRNEPKYGLHYVPGANISKIWNAGKFPFQNTKPEVLPLPGDICFISAGPPITEHVFVVLSTSPMSDGSVTFEVAEAGQTNTQGKQCARIHKPIYMGSMVGTRRLVGWVNLQDLTYAAPALLVGPDGSPLA